MNCACGGVYWQMKWIHIYSCEQTPKCPHCSCRQDLFPWEPRHNETCKILQHPNPLEISLALSRLPKSIHNIIYNFLPNTYDYKTILRDSKYFPCNIGSSDLKLYYITESMYESEGYFKDPFNPGHIFRNEYAALIDTLPTTIPNESIKQIKLRQKKLVPKLSRLERKPLLPKMRFYK